VSRRRHAPGEALRADEQGEAEARVGHHRPAIDGRTTHHPAYSISQRIRKRVEEIFGWTKTVALFRKTRFKGVQRTNLASRLVGAAVQPAPYGQPAPAPNLIGPDHRSSAALDEAAGTGKTRIVAQAIFNSLLLHELGHVYDEPLWYRGAYDRERQLLTFANLGKSPDSFKDRLQAWERVFQWP
jgi:hypothetical protein